MQCVISVWGPPSLMRDHNLSAPQCSSEAPYSDGPLSYPYMQWVCTAVGERQWEGLNKPDVDTVMLGLSHIHIITFYTGVLGFAFIRSVICGALFWSALE